MLFTQDHPLSLITRCLFKNSGRKLLFSLLVLLLGFAACSTDEASLASLPVEQGETLLLTDSIQELRMDLRINDTVEYEGQQLTLTEIVDSRCPRGIGDILVSCNWQGEVQLAFSLSQPDGTSQTVYWWFPNASGPSITYSFYNVVTHLARTEGPFPFGNFELRVMSVEPYPVAADPNLQEPMVVEVLIQRKE